MDLTKWALWCSIVAGIAVIVGFGFYIGGVDNKLESLKVTESGNISKIEDYRNKIDENREAIKGLEIEMELVMSYKNDIESLESFNEETRDSIIDSLSKIEKELNRKVSAIKKNIETLIDNYEN